MARIHYLTCEGMPECLVCPRRSVKSNVRRLERGYCCVIVIERVR